MGRSCCIVGCKIYSQKNILCYRLPNELNFKHKIELNNFSIERRKEWLKAINRADWTASKLRNARVCSRHFISGKPAALTDKSNPDWVPTQHLGYTKRKKKKDDGTDDPEVILGLDALPKVCVSSVKNKPALPEVHEDTVFNETREDNNGHVKNTKTKVFRNSDVDFEKTCRFCLAQSENLISLDNTLDSNKIVNVSDFVSSITYVRILKDDNLPQNICDVCYDNATNIFLFINQCQNTYKKLRQIYEHRIVKQKNKEKKLLEHDYASFYQRHSQENTNLKDDNIDEMEAYLHLEMEEDQNVELQTKNSKLFSEFEKNYKSKKLENSIQEDNSQIVNDVIDSYKMRNKKRKFYVQESYVCRTCYYSFATDIHLIAHMCQQHDRTLEDIGINEIKPSHDVSLPKGETASLKNMLTKIKSIVRCYKCETCEPPGIFQLRAHCIDHQINVHNQPYETLTHEQISTVYYDRKGNKLFDKIVETETNESNVKVETQEEEEEVLELEDDLDHLICPIEDCGLSFPTKTEILQHGVIEHKAVFIVDGEDDAEPTFECEHCSKVFQSKTAITHHIKYMHLDILDQDFSDFLNFQTFFCNDCDQNFSRKDAYDEHLKNHQKSKKHEQVHLRTFECRICLKRYSTKEMLQKHYIAHGDVAFRCSKCGIAFASEQDLQCHVKTHTKFTCSICSSTFHTRRGYEAHLKFHKNVRLFDCIMCEHRFVSRIKLKVHLAEVHHLELVENGESIENMPVDSFDENIPIEMLEEV